MVFILILPLKIPYHPQNDPGRICQKKLSKSLTTTVPRGLILSSSFARRTKEFGKTSLHRHVALSETGTLPTDCSNALHAVTPRIQLLCFNFLDPSYSFSVLAEPGAEETSRSASANKRAVLPRIQSRILVRALENNLSSAQNSIQRALERGALARFIQSQLEPSPYSPHKIR